MDKKKHFLFLKNNFVCTLVVTGLFVIHKLVESYLQSRTRELLVKFICALNIILYLQLPCVQLMAGIKFAGNDCDITLVGSTAQLVVDSPITGFNGTLKATNKTTSSITKTAAGNTITFANGGGIQFNNGGANGNNINNYTFDGVLDSVIGGGTNTLTFSGNNTLNCYYGTIGEALSISGTGNSINGEAWFNNPITLTNSGTSLNLGLSRMLNQSITLNSGTLTLTNNLQLGDGSYILGSGTVNVANYALTLGFNSPTAWSGSITWQNANNITLSSITTLSGTWTFSGGTPATITGNDYILDLSSGGTISVGAATTLNFIGVHIKGLGASGGTISVNATGTVNFYNSVIELKGNYTLSAGNMAILGDNCHVIAVSGYQLIVSGASTVFTVNGVVLGYNALGGTLSTSPVVTASSGTISLLNNGAIQQDNSGVSGGGGSTPPNYNLSYSTSNTSATASVQLTSGTSMSFTNATPATPKAMTYDGAGNYLDFGNTSGTPFQLAQNVTLTVQNVIVHNFNPNQISYGGSGGTLAKIVFGDNVTLNFAQDTVMTSYPAIVFTGNGVIDGGNSTISLSSQQIQQTGAGKTLTLRNTKIKCLATDSIICSSATATINLQNTSLAMTSAGLSFATGNLTITDNATILGSNATSSSGSSTFTFASAGLLTVGTNSTLNITKNTTFAYNPNTAGDGGVVSVQKRHMVFTDTSSTLNLDHCNVNTGTVGMALDHGNIYINGQTTFTISTNANAQLDLGSNCNVIIAPGANLTATGPVKYTAST